MARISIVAFVVLSCAFASLALAKPIFTILGKVYCDTCRAGFETNVTRYIEGAKVRLECKHFVHGTIQHRVDGATDKDGMYKLELKDNHENEICEVALVESPIKDCAEIASGRDRARIMLSENTGITSNVRYANPLGFLMDKPLDICSAVLKFFILGEDE